MSAGVYTVHYTGPSSPDIDLWFGDLVSMTQELSGEGLSSQAKIEWQTDDGSGVYSATIPTYWTSTLEEFKKYGC